MRLEFVVPERPVSAQSRRQKNIQAWRTMVAECASAALGDAQIEFSVEPIAIRVWYFYEEAMLDADNVVKPIQDALKGLAFLDDSVVTDIEVHRRYVRTTFALQDPSPVLVQGLALQTEFVYVVVTDAPAQDVLP